MATNSPMPRTPTAGAAVKIVAWYAASATAYIIVSDIVLHHLALKTDLVEEISIAKGWMFIAVSAVWLFKLIRDQMRKNDAAVGLLEEQVRAFHLITECDEAIWRADGRQHLFEAVCQLAVEKGGYRTAWIGLAVDDAEKSVVVGAHAGSESKEFMDGFRMTWGEGPRGLGPTGSCLREGAPNIARFIQTSARMAPWNSKIKSAGLNSAASFPLRLNGRTIAALTLCSVRADAFDTAEAALMNRLASSISFALDALERRSQEAKLLEQLQVLAHAIDASPVSVVITDAKGRIEFVNRKFTQVSGYTAEEAIGQNPRILKTGETSPEEYRRLWTTITAGNTWQGLLHNKRKNGDTWWESAIISPIRGADGTIRRFIALKEDITERRSLEQQLRQAQKMESLGALAGGVAHDFNNIMTIIQGHCELLDALAGANAPVRESVSEIRVAAERASAMTKRLLQFGRKQAMRLAPVDLAALVNDSARMLRRLIGENHRIVVGKTDEPLIAKVDAGMIEQVLMNLALNARDAMPEGGAIKISIEKDSASVVPPQGIIPGPEGFARLTVADRGHGIAPGDLLRVFEPFFTTKEVGKGTGLGLSVVDGIVRQHRGWVEVDSEVGRGTRFMVHLPMNSAPSTEPADEAPTTSDRGNERLLLVEDDASLRAMVARSLRGLGYAVTEAESGPAALAAWDEHGGAFDLLLTDMVMPEGMTGSDLARALRSKAPRLRVIVMSGYSRELAQGAARTPDGHPFVGKPFKPAALARAVRAELDRV